MNKKTLLKRVSKMIENPKFDCETGCPKRHYYFKNPQLFGLIKGEYRGVSDTCLICRRLFGLPKKKRIRPGCPCWQFGDNKEAVKAHVYKVLKREGL